MDIASQVKLLTRGCVAVVSEEELKTKLACGRRLRVKLGVDPTSADLHLGHSVVLSKLRAFQDLGHTAVLIIGDFTALIGDPSGRDSTRPPLSPAQVQANAATYKEQAFKVLDPERTELRFNSEWLGPFAASGLLETMKNHTVQQILAREDFKARMRANSPLTLLEIFYPIFQGQDSVAVQADVELGGNDQLTNLLMGRKMQQDAGQQAQVAMTLPLLVGLDGEKKMSKSYGNHISLTDPPNEIFGKVMKLSDELMWSYYELLTQEDVSRLKAGHPMEAKKSLAEMLTARFHGPAAGKEARKFFEDTFSKKELPTDIPSTNARKGVVLGELLVQCGVKSRNEARRLIQQGAVKIDGKKAAADTLVEGPDSFVLQIGKRQFVRVNLTRG